ncbi:MAG TPA: hypothetical protein VLX85_04195, partial [Stellaceae bacterium]|nr:hypothetical protein [Stellaceae bacterium]
MRDGAPVEDEGTTDLQPEKKKAAGAAFLGLGSVGAVLRLHWLQLLGRGRPGRRLGEGEGKLVVLA